MRSLVVSSLLITILLAVGVEAIGGKNALYVGGTIPRAKEATEGRLDTSSEEVVTFTGLKKGSETYAIPYKRIIELEYGQKAGRRVAVGILISPLALFSKKRNHYLTISYKDEADKEQAAVFELGKDIVRTTLKVLETRSGQSIKFQDDEARKSLGGGK
jgi:hypothetical protein